MSFIKGEMPKEEVVQHVGKRGLSILIERPERQVYPVQPLLDNDTGLHRTSLDLSLCGGPLGIYVLLIYHDCKLWSWFKRARTTVNNHRSYRYPKCKLVNNASQYKAKKGRPLMLTTEDGGHA